VNEPDGGGAPTSRDPLHDDERPGLVLPEEDGLFARDIDGQLVRMDKVTAADFDRRVTIRIDGREVTVPKAVALTDAQGKILRDQEGRPLPRATTIFDAATRAYAHDPAGNPIPVLCHREHLEPVAVCRVCCVEIAKVKRGSMQRERKLLPACQHRVEETMEVHTIRSPDLAARRRIDTNVRTLVNLLVNDHLPADWESQTVNELGLLARRLDGLALEARGLETAADPTADPLALEARWPLTGRQPLPARDRVRGHDDSSPRIAVDHEQCILCDRCVRSCSDVKENFVIGRTGKGSATRIGFDLDDPMGSSSCVSCGECMISCPTGALVFKEKVSESPAAQAGGRPRGTVDDRVAIDEFDRHPLFAGVPRKFLEWNADAVQRRVFEPGEVICRQGEYAFTAFVILRGRVGVSVGRGAGTGDDGSGGGLRAFARGMSRWLSGLRAVAPRRAEPRQRITIDGGRSLELVDGRWVDEMTPEDVIFGEMACLNHYPRSATIVAIEATEVLEINRNVLHMLQRTAASRRVLDRAYRARTLQRELARLGLFKGLSAAEQERCAALLRDRVELVRVDRGQVIFRQGDVAADLYQVRLGFVKVSQRLGGEDRVINYLRPGQTFGEVGLAAAFLDPAEAADAGAAAAGVRSATCTALDDVELVRVRGADLRALVAEFPTIREQIRAEAAAMLERDAARRTQTESNLGEFVANGLYSAQKLLVLDLESCTRCDECTRACSDTHEGITRLIREGLRFENFLVASSCRSCLDPYCLVGCPVDAIHRKPREGHPGAVEIVIEDHCIGCGLCSTNCPYGNISMHEVSGDDEGRRRRATTCDLCRDLVGPNDDPSCVYACPHNAAFRMSGTQLLEIVSARRGTAP